MKEQWKSLAVAALIGCGGGHASVPLNLPVTNTATTSTDSAGVTTSEIALGDSVFNGRPGGGICATCHGPDGVGTGAAPSLSDTLWINGDGSLGFIEGTVHQGVQHPKQYPLPMPPFGHTLTERQLHAVAAYVYSLSHRRSGGP
jgi:mono/diheme cytochrome c family protein